MFFRKSNRKAIGLLMTASAIFCLLASAAWSVYSYHLTRTALHATGHITEMVKRNSDRGDYWYPVYIFTDRDGLPHTVHSEVGSYPPQYSVGDAVTVLYYPGAANDAHLNEWSTLWGVPLILLGLGAMDLLIGTLILLWPRLARQPQTPPGG